MSELSWTSLYEQEFLPQIPNLSEQVSDTEDSSENLIKDQKKMAENKRYRAVKGKSVKVERVKYD